MVCDINQHLVGQLKEKFVGSAFTTSFEEVLQNPDVEAVIVATPAVTHSELAKKVILAGKDVFVEFLPLRVEEGPEIVPLADSYQRILMVWAPSPVISCSPKTEGFNRWRRTGKSTLHLFQPFKHRAVKNRGEYLVQFCPP
jgi:hypothetical protein